MRYAITDITMDSEIEIEKLHAKILRMIDANTETYTALMELKDEVAMIRSFLKEIKKQLQRYLK